MKYSLPSFINESFASAPFVHEWQNDVKLPVVIIHNYAAMNSITVDYNYMITIL